MMNPKPTVAVIGAGPCGVAAAVQVRRNEIPVLLFEARAVGGLLHNAHRVENYPGIPGGLSGEKIARLLERHLETAGITVIRDTVTCLTPDSHGYLLRTASGRCHPATAVIAAMGTYPDKIDIPWTTKEAASKVFHEVRDLPVDLRGKRAAVIGGSDAAYDYALNLSDRGCEVAMLQRGERRCLPLLARRAGERKSITILERTRVDACAEREGRLEISFDGPGTASGMTVDYLLIACGRSPENRLLDALPHPDIDSGEKTKAGEIRKTTGVRKTAGAEGSPWPGIFAGGDLVRGLNRQAGIAVGDGLVAAMQAVRYTKRIVPG